MWSFGGDDVFSSEKENNPWFQWHLPVIRNISGVSISFSNVGDMTRFYKNFVIRVANDPVLFKKHRVLAKNEVCGSLIVEFPVDERKVYTVNCQNSLTAEYITIQSLDKSTKLGINEMEIILTDEGN